MRKVKKFSEGGKAGRAERMRARRMADIEKDYQKALAKGKSEKVAQAKRDQRIADAKDDYAKRTGADRTETRAAEKAAEAHLKAARRSPNTAEKRSRPAAAKADASPNTAEKRSRPTAAKVGASPNTAEKRSRPTAAKVGASSGKQTFSQAFAAARKRDAKTFTWNGKSYTTNMRGKNKPAAATRSTTSSTSARTAPAAKSGLTSDQYTRALNTGIIPGNASAEDRANLRTTIKALQEAKYKRPAATTRSTTSSTSARTAPKQGYVAGSSRPAQAQGFAKGGSTTKGKSSMKEPKKMARGGEMMARGGKVKKMARGGMASKRADGAAAKGKTKCKMR